MNENTPADRINERSQSLLEAITNLVDWLRLWLREFFASIRGNGDGEDRAWLHWVVGIAAIAAIAALSMLFYQPAAAPPDTPKPITLEDVNRAVRDASSETDARWRDALKSYQTKIDEHHAAIAELRARVDTLSRVSGGKKPK